MKRKWKITLGISGALVVLGAGGMAWLITQPPPPAKIVEAGHTGQRIAATEFSPTKRRDDTGRSLAGPKQVMRRPGPIAG